MLARAKLIVFAANRCVPCLDTNASSCSATKALSCKTSFSLIADACEPTLNGCGTAPQYVNPTSAFFR